MNTNNIPSFLSKYKETSYFYRMESFFSDRIVVHICIKNQIIGIDKYIPFTISWYTNVPDLYNYFVAFIIK